MGRNYFIGVDTGGTYTDAAVIDADGHRVVTSAKALTTKGDLAIGVSEAIAAAVGQMPAGLSPGDVSLVSVSTTLATNAVVEGHGSTAGALLIGFDAQMAERTGIAKAFPGLPLVLVAGGHDHNGDEKAPLDEAAITAALERMNVEAIAIASAFAVRNPAHEQRAREMVRRLSGAPVTVSTELSSALDAPRRAMTAVLNARLISRIASLIGAVERAMAALGISCPVMIVKGDGTLALAQSVVHRPIETVLSGPAASLVGAAWLSGVRDFIMSDMGGTTTDLGVLTAGRPRIAEEGAEVGGWRTMVKAIDVKTIGLGGDSEVHIGMDGKIGVGPQRVVPVSLIGSRFPETAAMLEADLADTEGGSMHGKFVMLPLGGERPAVPPGLPPREAEVLALVKDRPQPLRRIAVSSTAQRALAALRKKGLVQLCGFTPSDAAHVLDLQANWARPAAYLAAQLAVRFRDMKAGSDARVRAFCQEVWSETVRLSGRVILDLALGPVAGGDTLLNAVCGGEPVRGLARVAISPTVPVVAVGGPVKVYYDEVGRRLDCRVIYPPFCDVANAVGAATGAVAATVEIEVEGDGSGLFRVHGPAGVQVLTAGGAALAKAEELAREAVSAQIRERGADSFDLKTSCEKSLLPDAIDDNGLLKAKIVAEAVGRPYFSGN